MTHSHARHPKAETAACTVAACGRQTVRKPADSTHPAERVHCWKPRQGPSCPAAAPCRHRPPHQPCCLLHPLLCPPDHHWQALPLLPCFLSLMRRCHPEKCQSRLQPATPPIRRCSKLCQRLCTGRGMSTTPLAWMCGRAHSRALLLTSETGCGATSAASSSRACAAAGSPDGSTAISLPLQEVGDVTSSCCCCCCCSCVGPGCCSCAAAGAAAVDWRGRRLCITQIVAC